MRIAFFTALKEERVAVRAAWPLQDAGTLQGLHLDAGDRAVSFCTGVGADRMRRAVALARSTFQPQLLVLVGFSAGLQARLTVGEVVCDERSDERLVGRLRRFPLPLRFGRTATCELLHTSAAKRSLAEQCPEALIADMETEAFLEAAGGLPSLVIRAVSDDVETDLPLPFDEFLDRQGFPDEKAILRRALGQPSVVPGLVALGRSSWRAQEALRETIRDLRPLLVERLWEGV